MSLDPVIYSELASQRPLVGQVVQLSNAVSPVDISVGGMRFLREGYVETDPALFDVNYWADASLWSALDAAFGTSIIYGVASDGDGVWVAVGDSGKAARSTDNGATWTDITTAVPFGTSIVRGVASDGADTWVAVGNSGIAARSTDNGVTWTDITTAVPFGTSIIWGVASDGDGVWVAVASGGIAARSVPSAGIAVNLSNEENYIPYVRIK